MKLTALFRQAAPRLMWAGQVTSATGDRLYAVALTWLTLRLTGSPAAVSLVTLAGTLPFLAASVFPVRSLTATTGCAWHERPTSPKPSWSP